MNKNIVLVGFMGAGKSVAANELAERLNLKAVSTDEIIEEREKRTIAQIFTEQGEKRFRQLEKGVVQELAGQSDLVIDCGGGIVLDRDNIQMLQENGIMIYLKASADVIYERTKGYEHRPLLNVDNPREGIQKLLEEREPMYALAAHSIDTDGKKNEQVCDEIMEIIKLC